jgi:AcrR family transcriptional regulator
LTSRGLEDGAAAPAEPLYRGLQPRWSGLDSEQVARHQRLRLYGAMIEAVAGRGYTATSVRELARLAGVSKRTVYDRFDSKEGYFLATFDHVVGSSSRRISDAYASESDPTQGLCAAFQAFLDEVAQRPGAARLALVEVLGAGPAALERMDRGRRLFETMIAASLPDGELLPPLILTGIVGGVERVTRRHLIAGAVAELADRAPELSAWASCYDARIAAGLASAVAREHDARDPPRASTNWVAWLCRGDEQTRLLRATAAIAGREGYAALEPRRIARLAKLPADAMAELYDSTEDCFMAAYELLGVEALACATMASQHPTDWRVGIHDGLTALMDHFAEHPVLARVLFVEVFALGPSWVGRRNAMLERFVDLLSSRVLHSEYPPGLTADLIIGAIWTVMHQCVARRAKHLLPSLAGQATFLALAPLIGAEEAAGCIRAGAGSRPAAAR